LELAWTERCGRVSLRISGWDGAELRELGAMPSSRLSCRLAVLPGEIAGAATSIEGLQPIAGRFEVKEDRIFFEPRFPFVDGAEYALLVLDPGAAGIVSEVLSIRRPAPAGEPATEVLGIYPSAGDVPLNLLKLYVYFSAPMSEGRAGRAVHVRRADTGEQLEGVFLPSKTELWDRERRRLTLLLDPGRIKRGLAPNEEAGYPLTEGVPIAVHIDAAFRDAAGLPLSAAAERRYAVGPAERTRVDPARWRLDYPAPDTTEPLVVVFDRPLDHALLLHCLRVHDAAGRPLAGSAAIGAEEQSWRFEPASSWEVSRYALVVDPRLEDLAGNSVVRVFDRDLLRPEDAPLGDGPVRLAFDCHASVSAHDTG
jgi:hypothetical protein